MNEIIGHDKILIFFDKVIENGNLSHAYLFVGPDQVGKKTVAREIGVKLLKIIDRKKLDSSPDYVFVNQVLDEKTGKTKKDISIAQMRGLRESLSHRSYLGGYKIAIIDSAEKMSIGAANALLKTLEEPSEKTVLFLVTDNDAKLPQTIRSRSQAIYFSLVKEEDLKKIEKDEERVKLSQGRPGRLIDWQNNQEDFVDYKKEVERFKSLEQKPFFEKIKIVEDLFGDKVDHIATRENLDNILQIWLLQVRERILSNIDLQENKIFLQTEKQIVKTRDLLKKNIHPRLLVENILLLIP